MLTSAVKRGSRVAEEGVFSDTSFEGNFRTRCTVIHDWLYSTRDDQQQQRGEVFQLDKNIKPDSLLLRNLKLVLEQSNSAPQPTGGGIEQLRNVAKENLGWLPLPTLPQELPSLLLSQLSHDRLSSSSCRTDPVTTAQLVMNSIDQYM